MLICDGCRLCDLADTPDVTIVCGDFEASCNKTQLSRLSEYFKMMFSSAFGEATASELVLDDEYPETMLAILQYLHDLEYDVSDVPDELTKAEFHVHTIVTAKKYLLPGTASKL